MTEVSISTIALRRRRSFIGGSDARIIMGHDDAALQQLWREKRREAEAEHSQLGQVTELLNRLWYERNTGHTLENVRGGFSNPVLRWMAATVDDELRFKHRAGLLDGAAVVVLRRGGRREIHGATGAPALLRLRGARDPRRHARH
jgi:predicted phage-related endonuclease